uniref:Uncharacterized protein n=1 Tax=Rheinheimera sp. BAL341 TaxID=1708203 RepID=A0A486XVJ4_9GAMM
MAAWREANTPKPQPKVAEKPAKPKKLAPLMSGATSLASEALRVRATFVQLSSNNASTKPSAFAYLEIQNLENRIIRYQRVAVGDMIDGYKIESVSGDMVTMRRQPTADNPDTLLLEIAVFGKRNE